MRIVPYLQMARIDRWPRNTLMLLGALVAVFFEPARLSWVVVPRLTVAFLATCAVTSANYVVNELLDAPSDRFHPMKWERPAAIGTIHPPVAVVEWILLAISGLLLGLWIDQYFAVAALALWLMGIVYNVPPIRAKDVPGADIIAESANNVLRLLLGWFTLIHEWFPPLSLLAACWMAGAFFMAIKRLAEYRRIADAAVAAAYRRSFVYYNDERLLVSACGFVAVGALFAGIFIVRYHLELILGTPVFVALLCYCLKLGLQEDSPVQSAERLYRDPGFLLYAVASVVVFALLLFIRIPALYELFHVKIPEVAPLWRLANP